MRFFPAVFFLIALAAFPLVAFADAANDPDSSIGPDWQIEVIDKAQYYEEDLGLFRASPASSRVASIAPINLSEDIKYFAKYESSCNYDQGFSRGDDYHALGYYQFDHRYGLQSFLIACYRYDPEAFHMFEQFTSVPSSDFEYYDSSTTESAIRSYNKTTGKWGYTALGNALNEAWHEAYAANPDTFSGLQDAWAYNNYYLPAEKYLKGIGIDISGRSDCVKGLCWGMCNLFGSSGWRKFVGGVSAGYDWDGVYHSLSEGYVWPGCGLSSSMTDIQFVTALCNYVVENVSVFYKTQSAYHAGWENRYRNELSDCLNMLNSYWGDYEPSAAAKAAFSDINEGTYHAEAIWWLYDNGITTGFPDRTFRPMNDIARCDMAAFLYRLADPESYEPSAKAKAAFADVNESTYHAEAIWWLYDNGITTGFPDGTFRPVNDIARCDMAAFLFRLADPESYEPSAEARAAFADVSEGTYHAEAIWWLYDNGITTGFPDGTFRPVNDIARCDMAAFLYRIDDRFA